ncbi:MAG: [FeFe] hydrogenase, group A [Planctomycetaceae bacterium]|nr:[FeFe] hydrogenase, group A [Planctomycetaceae bacterium]
MTKDNAHQDITPLEPQSKPIADNTNFNRRAFLTAGLAAGLIPLSAGCHGKPSGGEGWLPEQFNSKGTIPNQLRGRVPIDKTNPSICRDDSKCILCGQCALVCDKDEAVLHHYKLPLVNDQPCVHCGQCTLWCPTGAITEVDDTRRFEAALADPDVTVVVHTAPSTRVGIGEEFGLPVGTNAEGKQVAALRALGVNTVLDTNFTADLTITEEAQELVNRITGKEGSSTVLPQFTSCCPGWVKYCEYFYPDLIPNLSSAKSPLAMMGALVKAYYAEKQGLDPRKIFVVAIMPCTAKKFEILRPEINDAGEYLAKEKNDDSLKSIQDTDLVLTTRELANLVKRKGINWNELDPAAKYDELLSQYTGGGAIFGATGGVMMAAVRTAYWIVQGKKQGEGNIPQDLMRVTPIEGVKGHGIKEAKLNVPGAGEVRVAVITGLTNAHIVLDQIRKDKASGTKDPRWHFIEFMACPGGCISGGGQPKTSLPPSDLVRTQRIGKLYELDESMKLRNCHENPELIALYKDFLGEYCGHKSHELLHTHYSDKSGLIND